MIFSGYYDVLDFNKSYSFIHSLAAKLRLVLTLIMHRKSNRHSRAINYIFMVHLHWTYTLHMPQCKFCANNSLANRLKSHHLFSITINQPWSWWHWKDIKPRRTRPNSDWMAPVETLIYFSDTEWVIYTNLDNLMKSWF